MASWCENSVWLMNFTLVVNGQTDMKGSLDHAVLQLKYRALAMAIVTCGGSEL